MAAGNVLLDLIEERNQLALPPMQIPPSIPKDIFGVAGLVTFPE